MKALEEKHRPEPDTKTNSQDARTEEESLHIPVVHDTRQATNMTGMLTERQNTWIDGFPNEGHVENPILYK